MAAPVIKEHPVSRNKLVGEDAIFTLIANANPTPTYQWRKDGVNIGGATGVSYEIDRVALEDEGDYDCVVTNADGSATSNAATLSISDEADSASSGLDMPIACMFSR